MANSGLEYRDFHYFQDTLDDEDALYADIEIKRCVGINAKEAENVEFAREVIGLLPEFLDRPNVLGIGEIGLHKNSRNEV